MQLRRKPDADRESFSSDKRLVTSCGGVAERLKAAVLKTVEPRGSVGSNPTASAREKYEVRA